MANDDGTTGWHPADEIHREVIGIFNGDNMKQALREAWDRMTNRLPSMSAHDRFVQQLHQQSNDQRVQDANKSFLDADKAAQIRQKAMQSAGGK